MAKKLKCWRKTRHGENWGKGRFIILNIDGNSVNVHNFNKGINPKTNKILHKKFKTKSQATTFANSYMKKHDKC